MKVKTSSGFEELNENEINLAIQKACDGLEHVNWCDVASRCKVDWYDGITTLEIIDTTTMAAASLIEDEPNYEFVAARLLLSKIYKEVKKPTEVNKNLVNDRDLLFRYYGLRILYDRYFRRNESGELLETPQMFWWRVAAGIARGAFCPRGITGPDLTHLLSQIKEFYDVMSKLEYIPSTPTLFNAGTDHPQMASCYVQHVEDSLEGIFSAYADQSQLSKWAGGIGTNWSAVRGTGSKIKGTNGESTGLIPWLKIQNDIAVAVNQGGKRRGAHCAYLEPWHPDIEEFLDLRKPMGDDRRRTHDLQLALWIPDLFMRAVQRDEWWHLIDPADAPMLTETWGDEFEGHYWGAVKAGLYKRTIKARELWKKILTAKYETGTYFLCFKDTVNRANPPGLGIVRSSNLCTEITLHTSEDEIAVCNLGSINLERMESVEHLERTTVTAIRMLDAVVSGMWYPSEKAKRTNEATRPLGLGVMGYQNLKYKDNELSQMSDHVLFGIIKRTALTWSESQAPFPFYEMADMKDPPRRNSHLLAIAPTATIANIAGTTPSVEPLFSNLFVVSGLSGDYTQVNRYLVEDLRVLGLWTAEIKQKIKFYNGSIQNISEIPDNIKRKYRTAFEISQKDLIDRAAERQPWICQSQSLNLYVDKGITGPELSDLYLYAWDRGLKTTYYLRTLAASEVEKITVCDINNKEDCESCQ